MPPDLPPEDLLQKIRMGNRDAVDVMVNSLYQELREIAHRHRSRSIDATIDTTEIVHEAYLKLVDQSRAQWNDRAHFLATAAVAMRHILTDRARARLTEKRGGHEQVVTLDEAVAAGDESPSALLRVHEALDELSAIDERLARVVECRFFGGLTHEEIATALGVTVRTVERDWAKASTLLRSLLAS